MLVSLHAISLLRNNIAQDVPLSFSQPVSSVRNRFSKSPEPTHIVPTDNTVDTRKDSLSNSVVSGFKSGSPVSQTSSAS